MKQVDKNNTSFAKRINTLQPGQIEIKAYPNDKNEIAFYAEAWGIEIDWDDGNIEMLTPNGKRMCFKHIYPNRNLRTIKINTEGMTEFICCNSVGIVHELVFGNCPVLTHLYCDNNKLTSLNVNGCSALVQLGCYNNYLTALDVSTCAALVLLKCGNNLLTSLEISNCTALCRLNCSNNNLTSLDIRTCKSLTDLDCSRNQLSTSALDALFNSLLIRKPNNYATISYGYNPGYETCDKTIAEKKGWAEDFSAFPFLLYSKMSGAGTISCCDCGYKEDITSFLHWLYNSDSGIYDECSTGYQCQTCGKFHALSRKEERNNRQCDCGGNLEREKPIFCPHCKSKNIKYGMAYMT